MSLQRYAVEGIFWKSPSPFSVVFFCFIYKGKFCDRREEGVVGSKKRHQKAWTSSKIYSPFGVWYSTMIEKGTAALSRRSASPPPSPFTSMNNGG